MPCSQRNKYAKNIIWNWNCENDMPLDRGLTNKTNGIKSTTYDERDEGVSPLEDVATKNHATKGLDF